MDAGNADYTGPVTVTVSVPNSGAPPHQWTFTEDVSVKRGKTARVYLFPLPHYAFAAPGSTVPYTCTAAGHTDLTPAQETSGPAKVIWRRSR